MAQKKKSGTKRTKSDTKPPRRANKAKQQAVLKALAENRGIVIDACADAKVCTTTYYDWYGEDQEFRKAADKVRRCIVGIAERRIIQAAEEDPKYGVKAAEFICKTLGRDQGYVERQEVEDVGPPLPTNIRVVYHKEKKK